MTGRKEKSPIIRRSFRARMRRTTRRTVLALPAATISLFVSAIPAHADLKLCNRMSYVIEAAIGIDEKSATATRGWFRIDPAACSVVAPPVPALTEVEHRTAARARTRRRLRRSIFWA